MFKKSKTSGSFRGGKMSSSSQEKKDVLESLGYSFDSISKKSGYSWSSQLASSDVNAASENEIVDDAWRDAGERACEALEIPGETWERMGVKEQADLILEALAK